jgi:ribonuclease P protein component
MTLIFRLTQSNEIMRVRRLGKSSAHPLVVLVALPHPEQAFCRVTVIAGKGVGGAVQRNRAKRRIRAALQELADRVQPGFDVVVVARKPVVEADYSALQAALEHLAVHTHWMRRTI